MKISTIKDMAILAGFAYIFYKIFGDWFPALTGKIKEVGRNIRQTWETRNMNGGDGDIDREEIKGEYDDQKAETLEKSKTGSIMDYIKEKSMED